MAVWTKQLVRHGMAVKAAAVMLASLILVIFVIVPLYSNISVVGKKIKGREKEAADLSNRVSILTGLDREVLRQRVDVLDAALPPKKDVLLYLSAVDGLSRELGLTFSGISLAPGDVSDASSSASTRKKVDDTVPGVHSLETDVKMGGNKDSIYSFLRAIEQSLPLMQVKDAKVSVTNGDNYSLSLRLGMLWASGDLANVKGAISLFDDKEEGYFQQLSSYRKFVPIVRDNSQPTVGAKSNLFAPVVIDLIEVPTVSPLESSESASN